MTTDHHPSSETIAAWIDGTLTIAEGFAHGLRHRIGLHVAGCIRCRQLVAEVRATQARMAQEHEGKGQTS